MKIYKKFNNNVVQSLDDRNREIIVIGNGISFNKKIGELIDKNKISKIFYLQNSEQRRKMMLLLDEIPIEHFEISERIITFAEHTLDLELHESVHLALTDHISFAIERYKQGFTISNLMLQEIKTMYEEEYIIGLFALQLIKNEFGVELPEDEAATIVTHIIDARKGQNDIKASKIMKIVKDTVNLSKNIADINIDENSLRYSRFIIHLKFFAQRVINSINNSENDNEISLEDLKINTTYPEAYEIAVKIAEFIEKDYGYCVNKNEVSYLSLHIQRLLKK